MNSTSQNPGQRLPLSSGPIDKKTLIATLATSACIALMFTLLLYAFLSGRNPTGPRLAFGFFVSVLPAVGAYVVLKLTNLFVSWWGAVLVYLALFVLGLFIQAYAR